MEVKKHAKLCEFGDQEDRMIRDRLVIGTKDTALQERLLRVSDLTLTKAGNQCRAAEAEKTQVKTLQERNVEVHAFQKAESKQGNQWKKGKQVGNEVKNSDQVLCDKCGWKHIRNKCPAYEKVCIICKKSNHFTVRCFFKNTQGERANGARTIKTRAKLIKDQNVLIHNLPSKTWSPGRVVDVCSHPRSYIVQNETGNIVRKNSLHLRPSEIEFRTKNDNLAVDTEAETVLPDNRITVQPE
ncbi:hypothetical protein ILUMI_23635 [Ignelater luminosus]|uniref:Uncharacterized protein n=1 Tax=Ignelater luminosus TaxID=2038154 RepID=A0A8K0CC25_IGNLU|nr:hypothetical protein ILUMI_23635 [Ignelater luminosus]